MHLRAPATGRGTSAFLWGVGLGGFVVAFMAAIDISLLTSLVVGLVSGIIVFVLVRTLGDGRRPGQGRSGAGSGPQ